MIKALLIAEGTSDTALIPIARWCIRQHYDGDVDFIVASFNSVKKRPNNLTEKIRAAHILYPSVDVLIIHRDVDATSIKQREQEISTAAKSQKRTVNFIPITPMTMTESWLLIDERGIYSASGNPNGNGLISLPAPNRIERIRDPKAVLFDLIRTASGLSSHRRQYIDVQNARTQCGDFITQFEILRNLNSFKRFEKFVVDFLNNNHHCLANTQK